jgi:hypothetical protein
LPLLLPITIGIQTNKFFATDFTDYTNILFCFSALISEIKVIFFNLYQCVGTSSFKIQHS